MNSKYLRLSQDASDLFYSEDEKNGNGRRFHWFSWKSLVLLLSVVVNVVLSLPLVLTLREKPTPNGFGEHEQATHVRVPTD